VVRVHALPTDVLGTVKGRFRRMAFLETASAVDCYVGGALRLAVGDPHLGPELSRAAFVLRLACTDLPAAVTLDLHAPIAVAWNDATGSPDVELRCSSTFLDAYMRGERRLVDALARGEVVARGRVSKLLKLLPVFEQSFSYYRELVDVGDQVHPMTGALA
jgi:hypothetical protein